MTIRKKIVLVSALALGAFFATLFPLPRALLNGVARLEIDDAAENVHRLQNGLVNRQAQLDLIARDYAQWDRTYGFMKSQDSGYVRTQLTDHTFKILHINLFMLPDQAADVLVYPSLRD